MLAKTTQMGHRLPFLKLFCYASARQLSWPLPSEDLGRYAALLGSQRGNASAPAAAVAAAAITWSEHDRHVHELRHPRLLAPLPAMDSTVMLQRLTPSSWQPIPKIQRRISESVRLRCEVT